MAEKICLDTDVLIDLINGDNNIEKIINKYDEIYITSTSVFEFCNGKVDIEKYKINLRKFKILQFDFDGAIKSSTIFRSLKEFGSLTDMGDIMIAGICIINNITLLTRNKKHFERVTNLGLKLV